MTIIDTHSHIYAESFDQDIDEVISRARQAGVESILLPNVDLDSVNRLHLLTDRYPNYCLPMMGLHPTSVTKDWEEDLKKIKTFFSTRQYIAVGEIGIDLYWDQSLAEEQKLAFEEQLRWSIEFDLPVSIHCRNAIYESVESIKKVGADKLRGVFHSFGGDMDELQSVLPLHNFLIGINGTLTYKKSTLPEVLKGTDLSRLIVETDAPYLPPVPYRGKRNEPSYTTFIIEKLAEIYSTSIDMVAEQTSSNARTLYRIN